MHARSGMAMHPSVYQWGTVFGKGGPILAAKMTIFLQKSVRGDYFWGGTDFGVTEYYYKRVLI